MKYLNKKNILFVLILIIVIVASKTYNRYYNPATKNNEPISNSKIIDDAKNSSNEYLINNNPSSGDTLIEKEIPNDQMEPGIHNEDSIFFDGMEKVYSILNFNDVEEIKNKLTIYIKNNITRQADECKVNIFGDSDDVLNLNIKVNDTSLFVDIPKNNPSDFTVEVE